MRKLCASNADHRFTLQLAFWDEFKLWESNPDGSIVLPAMDGDKKANTRRAANLAKFLASLIRDDLIYFSNVLKPIDLSQSILPPMALLFFRACFSALLLLGPQTSKTSMTQTQVKSDDVYIMKLGARLGASKASLLVRDQITVFISRHLKDAPPGLSPKEIAIFSKRRQRLVQCLRDAQRLGQNRPSA